MPRRNTATLRRLLAVAAILVGLIGMHSLLLADPAEHPATAAAQAAQDPAAPILDRAAPPESAVAGSAPQVRVLAPVGGEHADLIGACVLALLLGFVLLRVATSFRRLRDHSRSATRRPSASPAPHRVPRTPAAVLAVSRT